MSVGYEIDKDRYLNHLSDSEDIETVRRVLDLIEISINQHTIEATDFMDPYRVKLCQAIISQFEQVGFHSTGGYEEAERRVIIIFPDYHYLMENDYPIKSFRLKGNFKDLTHRDFLGSLIGLGINREKIGDILVAEDFSDIVVKDEIANYILVHLRKISNQNIKLSPIKFKEIVYIEDEYELINSTISSLRLDNFISSAYNLSRGDSQKLISRDRVKVNWEPIDKSSYEIKEGDIISTKGYGRSVFLREDGLSRKNKIRVTIKKLI